MVVPLCAVWANREWPTMAKAAAPNRERLRSVCGVLVIGAEPRREIRLSGSIVSILLPVSTGGFVELDSGRGERSSAVGYVSFLRGGFGQWRTDIISRIAITHIGLR